MDQVTDQKKKFLHQPFRIFKNMFTKPSTSIPIKIARRKIKSGNAKNGNWMNRAVPIPMIMAKRVADKLIQKKSL